MTTDGLRVCSECGTSLEHKGPNAKTCSPTCRASRSRRKRRAEAKAQELGTSHTQIIADLVRDSPDIAEREVREQMRPIIADAIDATVVESLNKIIGLTPRVVELLEADLEHPDDAVRTKAMGLIVRYTIGDRDLKDNHKDNSVTVNIDVPRPGQDLAEVTVLPEDVHELRVCEVCEKEKEATEFQGTAYRCRACHDEMKRKVEERFSGAG